MTPADPARPRGSVRLRTFSAIIAARDAASLVGDAVASIRAQPEPVEVVVVDDASSDDTAAAARLAGADVVVRLDDNVGPAGARNRGVAAASGEVIGFCDADDVWTGDRLSVMAAALVDGVDIVAGLTRYVGLGDTERASRRFADGDSVALVPSLSAVLVRRDALARVGAFPVGLTNYEDWDWLVAASDSGVTITTVNAVVSEYRRRPDSASQTTPPGPGDLLALLKRSVDRRRAGARPAPRPEWGSAP